MGAPITHEDLEARAKALLALWESWPSKKNSTGCTLVAAKKRVEKLLENHTPFNPFSSSSENFAPAAGDGLGPDEPDIE